MNLTSLIRSSSIRAGVPFEEGRRVVLSFLSEAVYRCMLEGESVTLTNIGRLEPVDLGARKYVGFGGKETVKDERVGVRLRSKTMEKDLWKSTESILSTVIPALFVAREQYIKDRLPYVLSTALLLSSSGQQLDRNRKTGLFLEMLKLLGVPRADYGLSGEVISYKIYGRDNYLVAADSLGQGALLAREGVGYIPENLLVWHGTGVYVHRKSRTLRPPSLSGVPDGLVDLFIIFLYSKYRDPSNLRLVKYVKEEI